MRKPSKLIINIIGCGEKTHTILLDHGRLTSVEHDLQAELGILEVFPLADTCLCLEWLILEVCQGFNTGIKLKWAENIWRLRETKRDWMVVTIKDNDGSLRVCKVPKIEKVRML